MSETESSSPAISKANEIASWFENQHEIEENSAQQQIRLILVTVLVGIFLLLVLPRLIQEIDYLWRADSMPPKIIEKAKSTQDVMTTIQGKIDNDVDSATKRRVSIENDLTEHKKVLSKNRNVLTDVLSKDLAIFGRVLDQNNNDHWTITKTIEAKDGTFIAAGFEDAVDVVETLLLHSTDGKSWTPIRPEESGTRLRGGLNSLLQAKDGTFIAAGFEDAVDVVGTLLLHSTDGKSWTPIRPEESGTRLHGGLNSLLQAKDGTFIAAGFEDAVDVVGTLLLHSTDGKSWTPIRPEESGTRLHGGLNSLLQAKDGTFIAAGFEDAVDVVGTLLLHSTDGRSWTPIRSEESGTRLRGGLNSLLQAKDGTFIAAGFEGTVNVFETLLLLRSTDGRSWTPIRPEESGTRLIGRLNSLLQAKDGTFIAAGKLIWQESTFESNFFGTVPFWPFQTLFNLPTALLLRSANGTSWTAMLLHKDGLELPLALHYVLQTKEGSVIVGGTPGSILKSPSEQEADDIRNEILNNLEVSPDLVLSTNIWPQLNEQSESRKKVTILENDFERQDKFVKEAENFSSLQYEVAETIKEVILELDQALRKAELVREAGKTATRIAVVALLIYLVQIMVNRYRYQLRLAKFYKGRAQALHLIVAVSAGRSPFENTSLGDLATALSPESIGFDKAPKPPDGVFSSRQ